MASQHVTRKYRLCESLPRNKRTNLHCSRRCGGAFRGRRSRSGGYLVGAGVVAKAGNAQWQPSVYYPGVPNRDRAQAIELREGQWRADLKIKLPLGSVSVRSDHLENGLKTGDAPSRDRCNRVREEIDGEFQNGSGGHSVGEWNRGAGVEATTAECRRASASGGTDAGSGSVGSAGSARSSSECEPGVHWRRLYQRGLLGGK